MSAQNIILLLILATSWSASGLHDECKKECYGSSRWPEGCTNDCKYVAEWCAKGDEVSFVVKAPDGSRRSVGIGFSKNNETAKSDAVIGQLRDDKAFVEDSWIPNAWRGAVADKLQDIYNKSFEHEGDIVTMRFVRKRKTEDKKNDIDLDCQYFLYAYGGVRQQNSIKKPYFEEISRRRICLCDEVDPTPDTKPTPDTIPTDTIPTHDTNTTSMSTCPSCSSIKHLCAQNATCKMFLDSAKENCKEIFEYDESTGESEPMCTDMCRESIMAVRDFGGDNQYCCDCGEINDDDNLLDVHSTIMCRQRQRNSMRLCFNDTVQMMCEECSHQEMNRPHSCFDVMNMCMKDRSCRKLMEDMERGCEAVTTWSQSMRRPVCSDKCRFAVANFFNHKIGRHWRQCDCRMPMRDGFVSLSRNENFEKSCRRSQNNMRTFCFYDISCRDGQQFKCDWLVSVCSKDPTCKDLYDDREQKCATVFSWTEGKTPPMCTDDCKMANEKLMSHSVWEGTSVCDCGNFINKTLKEVRQTEECIRRRINMILHCRGTFAAGGCPKDPCVPETCTATRVQCLKSTTCRELYDHWNEACSDLWNSSTVPCSDECKNTTQAFINHIFGRNFIGCDCGLNDDFLDAPKSQEEIALIGQCYERQNSMRERCGLSDAGQCQICQTKKVCPQPCSRIIDRCSNDTSCRMALRNYRMSCEHITTWNTSLALPVCTDECKKSLYELLETNPIGRHFKCCRCNGGNKKCVHAMRNIGFFCKVDLNNAAECQNNPSMCDSDDRQGLVEDDEIGEQREPRPRGGADQDQREREEQENQDSGPTNHDDQHQKEECDMNQRSDTEQRDQFGDMMMMEPPSCNQWVNRCRENKCCRKAFHEANHYCNEIKHWKNNSVTAPPVCSDACSNAMEIMFNDPIGKNLKRCNCGKFSDVDPNNFGVLKLLEDCKRTRRNLDSFCNLSQLHNFSQQTQEDKFEDVCSVVSCHELALRCQKNDMCKPMFDSFIEKCSNVVTADLSSHPTCSNDCKQARDKMISSPFGSKFKCCDCGRLTTAQMSSIPPIYPLTPPNSTSSPGTTPSPNRLPPTGGTPPRGMGRTPPSSMPPMNTSVSNTPPPMMSDMSTMIKLMSPAGCQILKVNIKRHCDYTDDECTDCKQQVCPRSCDKVIMKCRSDAKCSIILEKHLTSCSTVRSWNGTRSTQPECTSACKGSINELLANPIGRSMKCCVCDQTDRDERMLCGLRKRNIERACNVVLDRSDECQKNRKECNDTRRREDSVTREKCPPRKCDDWHGICSRDSTCTKYFNEAIFYCHTVLDWVEDQQDEPVCTPSCQGAMDRLASVTERLMGQNIWCCTCENYFEQRDNSLSGIRRWATCRRRHTNAHKFCKLDCPDCNRRPPPMSGNQQQSCSAASRMCNDISECRNMRSRIMSSCSDVIMWERDGDRQRPQCSSKCRQALMAMAGSRYSRTQQCCDCVHDDMTTMERRQCQQHHRNLEEICGARHDSCDNDRPNNMSRTNDCFNVMERCSRNMQCRDYFFNYTDKCARAFTGERMNAHQYNMCKEAAKQLFSYGSFGESITRCECNTYPELCKDLFKNRFLLDRPCMGAEARCRNDTACNALLRSHNSCKVTNGSCSMSCRSKAVLLYRHRLGRNWWQLCGPHNFEQVCFTLY